MKKKIKEAVERYQCLGCVSGCDTECYKHDPIKVSGIGCSNHHPGTMASGIGVFYLGMPMGFNRIGSVKTDQHALCIFEGY